MTPDLQRRLAEALPEILRWSDFAECAMWCNRRSRQVFDTEWLAVLDMAFQAIDHGGLIDEYGQELARLTGCKGPHGGSFTLNGHGYSALAHASIEHRATALLKVLNK